MDKIPLLDLTNDTNIRLFTFKSNIKMVNGDISCQTEFPDQKFTQTQVAAIQNECVTFWVALLASFCSYM